MSLINSKTLGLSSSPAFLGGLLDGLPNIVVGNPLNPPAAPPGAPFSAMFSFGDSLSDAGNLYALSLHSVPTTPYVNGQFSNGPVWVQDLAVSLSLPIPGPSVLGGTDFAYGGAETGSEPLHPQTPLDLPSQLAQFKITHPVPIANAVYTLSIGGNDVIDAIGAYGANPTGAIADIAQAVANESSFVSGLAADGARNLVVLNVPDLGKIPAEAGRGPAVAQLASTLSAMYDSQLSASLGTLAAADHLNLHVVDAYSLLDQGVANPSAFGLTNVTQPVWTGTFNNPASGTLNAVGAAQNGYLFFDGLHPTATGQQFVADLAHASLFPVA